MGLPLNTDPRVHAVLEDLFARRGELRTKSRAFDARSLDRWREAETYWGSLERFRAIDASTRVQAADIRTAITLMADAIGAIYRALEKTAAAPSSPGAGEE